MIGAMIGSMGPEKPAPRAPHWVPPSGDVLDPFRPELAGTPEAPLVEERPPVDPEQHVVEHPAEVETPPASIESEPAAPREPRPVSAAADDYDSLRLRDVAPIRPSGALRNMSGVALYWLVLVFVTPIACVGIALYNIDWRGEPDLGMGFGAGIFFFMPGIQLLSSLVAAVLVGFWPPGERQERLYQIGKITLFMTIGTLIGMGCMGVVCLPMMR
jgi:hypothetical protein